MCHGTPTFLPNSFDQRHHPTAASFYRRFPPYVHATLMSGQLQMVKKTYIFCVCGSMRQTKEKCAGPFLTPSSQRVECLAHYGEFIRMHECRCNCRVFFYPRFALATLVACRSNSAFSSCDLILERVSLRHPARGASTPSANSSRIAFENWSGVIGALLKPGELIDTEENEEQGACVWYLLSESFFSKFCLTLSP